jgi:hypothetical protein
MAVRSPVAVGARLASDGLQAGHGLLEGEAFLAFQEGDDVWSSTPS